MQFIDDIKVHLAKTNFVEFKGVKSNTPLNIVVNKNVRFLRFSLQTQTSFHLDTIEIFNDIGKNIAIDKRVTSSSSYNDDKKYNGQGVVVGKKNGGCGFHTKNEKKPWILIDLEQTTQITNIIVYNRDDECYARALSLEVKCSTNLLDWETLFDNWSFVKTYKNNNMSDEERALLFSSILEPSYAQNYLNSLKKTDEIKANQFISDVNSIINEKGLAFGPHGFMQTFELASESRKQLLFSELERVLIWLNEDFGVSAFVSSGTLLGIIRDGDFIPHDDDFDIGMHLYFDMCV